MNEIGLGLEGFVGHCKYYIALTPSLSSQRQHYSPEAHQPLSTLLSHLLSVSTKTAGVGASGKHFLVVFPFPASVFGVTSSKPLQSLACRSLYVVDGGERCSTQRRCMKSVMARKSIVTKMPSAKPMAIAAEMERLGVL
jgi:hypothetical protein